MKKQKEIIVFVLCLLSELGLFYQFYRPIYFIETDIIEKGTVSWTVPRAICLVSMLAIFLFALSVLIGNVKGILNISYAILMLYFAIVLMVMLSQKEALNEALNGKYIKMNIVVYVITAIVAILSLLLFILRRTGIVGLVPGMSSLMLLVVVGQFVTHGLFMGDGKVLLGYRTILCAFSSALPYFTIFIFERMVIEAEERQNG